MKKLFSLLFLILSFNAFSFSVMDSMYEGSTYDFSMTRDPASNPTPYCIVSSDLKVFAKSCYSSQEICTKRLEFWRDLPRGDKTSCVKI